MVILHIWEANINAEGYVQVSEEQVLPSRRSIKHQLLSSSTHHHHHVPHHVILIPDIYQLEMPPPRTPPGQCRNANCTACICI